MRARNSGGKYESKGQRKREKCGPNRQVSHDASVNLKQLSIEIAETSGMSGKAVRWYT